MKKIMINEIVKLEDREGEIPVHEMIHQCLTATPPEGMTYGDMTKSLPIMDKLKAAKKKKSKFVLLEDTEYNSLMEKFRTFRFAFFDSAFVRFVKEMDELPDAAVKVEE